MTDKQLDRKLETAFALAFAKCLDAGYDSAAVAAAMMRSCAYVAHEKGVDRVTFVVIAGRAYDATGGRDFAAKEKS